MTGIVSSMIFNGEIQAVLFLSIPTGSVFGYGWARSIRAPEPKPPSDILEKVHRIAEIIPQINTSHRRCTGGLEPPWVSPPPPQDGVSARSTTSAHTDEWNQKPVWCQTTKVSFGGTIWGLPPGADRV